MNHGGYLTLLGVPAAIALISFLARIRWLKRHGSPHNYGRTGWIYWPSQAFIALACLTLLASLLTSFGSSMPADGFLTGVTLLLLAWVSDLASKVLYSLSVLNSEHTIDHCGSLDHRSFKP